MGVKSVDITSFSKFALDLRLCEGCRNNEKGTDACQRASYHIDGDAKTLVVISCGGYEPTLTGLMQEALEKNCA